MAGISDRELNDLEAQTQGEDHSESELMPEEDIYKGDWYVVHTYSQGIVTPEMEFVAIRENQLIDQVRTYLFRYRQRKKRSL